MSALSIAEKLVKEFEGLFLTPYRDPVGFWTVGYGHLVSRDTTIERPPYITTEEAHRLLELDLRRASNAVARLCHAPLRDTQAGALIDFTFNCGSGNLEISTLRRLINASQFLDAAEEFPRWVYAREIKLSGLVRRRRAERELFLS